MDSVPVRGLDEFDRHLDDLIQDPTLELNAKLFDDIELQLTGRRSSVHLNRLVIVTDIVLHRGQHPSVDPSVPSASYHNPQDLHSRVDHYH